MADPEHIETIEKRLWIATETVREISSDAGNACCMTRFATIATHQEDLNVEIGQKEEQVDSATEKVTEQVTEQVKRLLSTLKDKELGSKEAMLAPGLHHRLTEKGKQALKDGE